MKEIPLYLMEEHHEAFYYWGHFIEKGYLSKKDNALFHIDHHDDLEAGGYFHDFTHPFENVEERRTFSYEKLGIADFIVPAIYEEVFSELYNMKRVVPQNFTKQERFVKRKGKNVLELGNYVPFLHSQYKKNQQNEYRFFSYFEGSLSEIDIEKNIVLDIDLDYFHWDDSLSGVGEKRMEITKAAYNEWMENRYHPFRILPKRFFYVKQIEDTFYLYYREPPSAENAADWEKIEKRIQRFAQWLKNQNWKPKVITICRSKLSGYLPETYSVHIEEKVIKCLEEIYALKIEEI